MIPRTILYTGKGGVGKTSVAASSALAIADRGLRTVVLSTDPAHSLSDSLDTALGARPTPVNQNLWGQELRAEVEMERNWQSVQQWLGNLLADRGVDRIVADELTVPPGMDEIFSLLEIKRHIESGDFDVIVVDCAPTGETLRLLSFPDVARWWLEKIFPWERRLMSAARPIAKTFLDIPLPSDDVLAEVQQLVRNLIDMNAILRNREYASVRLVMNPERMVIKEAQRTFTYLNLYGYLTDAVIVNRVFPADVDGQYFSSWRAVQQQHVELARQAFDPVPLLQCPFFEREVVGVEALGRVASAVFGDREPQSVLYKDLSQELTMTPTGAELCIRAPFVEKGEIDLKKIGLELVVRVGDYKRNIILPSAMASFRPDKARFEAGSLTISFSAEKEDDSHTSSNGRVRAPSHQQV